MPDAVTLPGDTSSVPEARRFVTSVMRAWGLADLGWSAALCVSELATNCALHARTAFTVSVERATDGRVRIEVTDGSRRVPARRDYGTDATTGRGLRLLDGLASGWGVEMRETGKTVWLLLDPADVLEDPLEDDVEENDDVDALLASFDDGDSDPVVARAA